MYKKRGQAALEFLMTYGWAILSAIIVIGALGSYFYFNQGGTTTVVVNAPFYGVSAAATTTTLSLEIANKGGEDLSTVLVNVTGNGLGCTQQTIASMAGASQEVVAIPCAGLGASGSAVKGNIEISYLRAGSTLPLTVTGSVSTSVA